MACCFLCHNCLANIRWAHAERHKKSCMVGVNSYETVLEVGGLGVKVEVFRVDQWPPDEND